MLLKARYLRGKSTSRKAAGHRKTFAIVRCSKLDFYSGTLKYAGNYHAYDQAHHIEWQSWSAKKATVTSPDHTSWINSMFLFNLWWHSHYLRQGPILVCVVNGYSTILWSQHILEAADLLADIGCHVWWILLWPIISLWRGKNPTQYHSHIHKFEYRIWLGFQGMYANYLNLQRWYQYVHQVVFIGVDNISGKNIVDK